MCFTLLGPTTCCIAHRKTPLPYKIAHLASQIDIWTTNEASSPTPPRPPTATGAAAARREAWPIAAAVAARSLAPSVRRRDGAQYPAAVPAQLHAGPHHRGGDQPAKQNALAAAARSMVAALGSNAAGGVPSAAAGDRRRKGADLRTMTGGVSRPTRP